MNQQLSLGARWGSVLAIGALALMVVIVRPFKQRDAIYSDGIGYHMWTRAVLEGDLSFRRYGGLPGLTWSDPEHRHYANAYPPGVALLRFPVMAFLVRPGQDQPLISAAEHWACWFLGVLALVGICACCLQASRRLGADNRACHLAVVFGVFGTGLFHYATYDACFSHIYSALGGAFLLWLGVRALTDRRETLPPIATGFACAVLILIRNTNVVLLAGLVAAYCLGRWLAGPWRRRAALQDLAAILCGSAAACLLQVGYNSYAQGHLSLSSYGPNGFQFQQPMQLDVLFSYRRGLFCYYPVVALILVVGFLVPRTRRWTGLFAAMLLAYTMVYGFWKVWWLGSSFGYRAFVDALPAGIVLLAVALAGMTVRVRKAAITGAVLCTFLTLQFMVGFWTWRLIDRGDPGQMYWQHVVGRRSVFRAFTVLHPGKTAHAAGSTARHHPS